VERIMFDSVDPYAIPVDADVVGGYDDGWLYRWPHSAWSRFKGTQVHITATGETLTAQVGDVEMGDMEPANAAAWRARQAQAHIEPGVVYCSLSRVQEVFDACGPSVKLFTAHYTFVPHLCTTDCLRAANLPGELPDGSVVATQYADHGPQNQNYDLSLCAPGWPA
jgi:hypothetical protein